MKLVGLGVLLLSLDLLWVVWVGQEALWRYMTVPTQLRYEAEATYAEQPGAEAVAGRYIEEHQVRILDRTGDDVTAELSTRDVDRATGATMLFAESTLVHFSRSSYKVQGSQTQAFFPRDVEERNYLLKQFSYFPDEGVVFVFRGRELVKNVEAYRFDFLAEGLDWTDSYDYSLPAGSSIHATDRGTVWIDPWSGTLLKHVESWEAYVVGGEHDKIVVDKGHMWLVDDTTIRQIMTAKNQRRDSILIKRVIPVILLILALVAFLISYRRSAAV